ncbi:MAG: hypothetical protein JXA37_04375, partial [Chloroflexia bacterium]|nr:hypothetical protein [Chloroflexia bacterium]
PPTTPPTTAPTTGPTPTWTPPPATPPTTGPTAVRPTDRPRPRPTRVPPTATICAEARVIGETCVAGRTVTISSCCPEWSAQTTADGSGHFEFGALTPGTFTVSAGGRSRTVVLEGCGSVVTVNLCPVTAAPTTPALTVTPVITPTQGPTAGPTGTAAPTTGTVTLALETDHVQVYAGENLTLLLNLRNGAGGSILTGVDVQCDFGQFLFLQGASAVIGTPRVSGQVAGLELDRLGAGTLVSLRVDARVRPGTAVGTNFSLQGVATTGAGQTIYSNVLNLEVVGGEAPPATGVPPQPTQSTAGGPEPVPTAAPTEGPGGLGQEIPYTGTGVPMAGVMLGGIVLLARQLRLRRAGRRED